MRRRLALLLLLIGAGCAWIPSRTEPWCLPRAKWDREAKRVSIGVKCAW